ncbi:MAG TPA: aldo/keto reductase [Patescibacteria group bacterium]|nr:aldo/keto reductase [Patescibacteria group bacterium]
MEYRELGKTGIRVSEVGFGAWAIGGDAWGPVEDGDSIAAMERALELGVNVIDTADVYGDGHSEKLVGEVIAGRRQDVVVSTKGGLMGHHRDPEQGPVYDRPSKVTEAFEASLRRLRTDYIDVYWCHIWWDNDRETEAFTRAFEELKDSGKARAVGISTDNIDHLRHFGETGVIDAVQLDYSILNRKPESDLLPYAEEHALGAVIRGPLFKGLLTGKFGSESTFGPGDIRHGWPSEPWYAESMAKVGRLRRLVREDQTPGQLALRFVLGHPAVSVTIPGAKNPNQVEQNAAASRRPLLSPGELHEIDAIAPAP